MARFNRTLAAAIGLLAGAFAGTSSADDHPRVELTPYYGYRFGGQFDTDNPPPATNQSADMNSSGAWGVDLGIYRDRASFYELLYSHQSTDLNNKDPALKGKNVTVQYMQAGGTLLFPGNPHVVPYFSATIGATQFGASGYGSDTKFSGSLGGGVRFPFGGHFAATLGVRGYLTAVSGNTSFFCASGSNGGTCLVKTSGSGFFQGEGLIGFTAMF